MNDNDWINRQQSRYIGISILDTYIYIYTYKKMASNFIALLLAFLLQLFGHMLTKCLCVWKCRDRERNKEDGWGKTNLGTFPSALFRNVPVFVLGENVSLFR